MDDVACFCAGTTEKPSIPAMMSKIVLPIFFIGQLYHRLVSSQKLPITIFFANIPVSRD
jgi:hypothetical protein